MTQAIGQVALVVRDYDQAIAFYVDTLGFSLIEDTFIEAQNKRWVLVAPPGSTGTALLRFGDRTRRRGFLKFPVRGHGETGKSKHLVELGATLLEQLGSL